MKLCVLADDLDQRAVNSGEEIFLALGSSKREAASRFVPRFLQILQARLIVLSLMILLSAKKSKGTGYDPGSALIKTDGNIS